MIEHTSQLSHHRLTFQFQPHLKYSHTHRLRLRREGRSQLSQEAKTGEGRVQGGGLRNNISILVLMLHKIIYLLKHMNYFFIYKFDVMH